MKSRYKLLFIFSIIFFTFYSCSDNEKNRNGAFLVDVSKFKIDTTMLHDGDSVKVLCASLKLFPTDTISYYVHTVVVSLKTGDTVNVLASGSINITEENRITEFYSFNNKFALAMQSMNDIKTGENSIIPKEKKYKKVHSDPQFIALKTSHFPSVIGMLSYLNNK